MFTVHDPRSLARSKFRDYDKLLSDIKKTAESIDVAKAKLLLKLGSDEHMQAVIEHKTRVAMHRAFSHHLKRFVDNRFIVVVESTLSESCKELCGKIGLVKYVGMRGVVARFDDKTDAFVSKNYVETIPDIPTKDQLDDFQYLESELFKVMCLVLRTKPTYRNGVFNMHCDVRMQLGENFVDCMTLGTQKFTELEGVVKDDVKMVTIPIWLLKKLRLLDGEELEETVEINETIYSVT